MDILLLIPVLDRIVKRLITADEVHMQLSHSQVIASHSAIHWSKQWNSEIRPQLTMCQLWCAMIDWWYAWDVCTCAWCADPVSSSCCTTFRLLILSRASSRTWMGSCLRDLVSQQRTVPSMDPGKKTKDTHTNNSFQFSYFCFITTITHFNDQSN